MKIKNLSVIATLFVMAVSIVGCGTGRVMDMSSPDCAYNGQKFRAVRVQPIVSGVTVPKEMAAKFEDVLQDKLYDDVKFKRGNELTLKYRFISMSEGSQFQRWFLGGMGGSGEGSLIVEVTYEDAKGCEIGKIRSEGKIGAGFFGGSFDHALEKAAEEIARHASRFKA